MKNQADINNREQKVAKSLGAFIYILTEYEIENSHLENYEQC